MLLRRMPACNSAIRVQINRDIFLDSGDARNQIVIASKTSSSAKIEEVEWEGTGENPEDWIRDEGFHALETQDAALLGQYFREAQKPDPEIIKRVANLLDPPNKNSQRLIFVSPRGRPVDKRKIHSAGNIRMMLVDARRQFPKLESAVAHISTRTGKSRSAIFALLATRKKVTKKKKSKKA
jgi:hypothetical protein